MAAGRTLTVTFILDFGKTWLEIPLVSSDFSMGFCARLPSAAAAQAISWLEWERKEIEEDFGERDPAPALVWELTHTLSISPYPACCAWVLCFPVESFLYFPLNQSVLGNINQGIMTNLSMWERKDVAAVFGEPLGSSYSRERARGLH